MSLDDTLGEWDTTAPSAVPSAAPAAGSAEPAAAGERPSIDWVGIPDSPDEPADLARARTAYLAAREREEAAEERLEEARDAAEDAAGAVTVAEARLRDVSADPAAKEWERIAAEEGLRAARRAAQRSQDVRRRREAGHELALQLLERAVIAVDEAERAPAEGPASDAYAPPRPNDTTHLIAGPVDHASGDVGDSGDTDDSDGGEMPSELYYSSSDEFLRDFLAPTYRRKISGERSNGDDAFRWAAEWWRHPEAQVRIEALWRSFEALRTDPGTGLSVWLRDHADHHVPILLSQTGPFRNAKDVAEDGAPLPYKPPPDGTFPSPDQPGSDPAAPITDDTDDNDDEGEFS